jgi:hypothetical protein
MPAAAPRARAPSARRGRPRQPIDRAVQPGGVAVSGPARRGSALDAELAALVARLGAPLAAARELTTLPSPVLERPAWRLELADGRVLKGRVFVDAVEAARFAALAAYLPRPGFPQLLERAGRAVLLEWIPGEGIGAAPPGALLVRCGALLGALHRQVLPSDAAQRFASDPTALPEPLEPLLDEIAAAGWLERAEADALAALARRAQPERCERGLAHLDFCAENLVVARDALPFCIDNATLAVAPLDYDLARTWMRWPLPASARGAFLTGYRQQRETTDFEAGFDYWRICALAHSARLRLRRRAGDVGTPVAGLRETLGQARARASRAAATPALAERV